MEKRYPASKFLKILTLGIKRYGTKIDNNILCIYSFYRKSIDINTITSIKSIFVTGPGLSGYYLKIRNKKKLFLPCDLMEGFVFQEFFRDLSEINRFILFDKRTNEFINECFAEKYKIKFDFARYKESFYKRDVSFIQRYPSLNNALILFFICTFTIIPIALALLGRLILNAIYGESYSLYRIILITFSSLPLIVIIVNLTAALISQYLGHKVTIICLVLFFALITIGLL